jgi:hypothetical protein
LPDAHQTLPVSERLSPKNTMLLKLAWAGNDATAAAATAVARRSRLSDDEDMKTPGVETFVLIRVKT